MIIYKATNMCNGKIYIGQTTQTLKDRIHGHISDSKRKNRSHCYFHNAIQKYGIDSFTFIIIDKGNNIEDLNLKEKFWIAFYHSMDSNIGYNLDSGGLNCRKAASSKKKIGEHTKLLWDDPNMSIKMMNGLKKGSVMWQKNALKKG